jgi:hypothetical protein
MAQNDSMIFPGKQSDWKSGRFGFRDRSIWSECVLHEANECRDMLESKVVLQYDSNIQTLSEIIDSFNI